VIQFRYWLLTALRWFGRGRHRRTVVRVHPVYWPARRARCLAWRPKKSHLRPCGCISPMTGSPRPAAKVRMNR